MAPLLLAVALIVVAVVSGFIAVAFRASKLEADGSVFHARCAAIGFLPLTPATPAYVACGGERQGYRVMLMLAGAYPGLQLPSRVDVLLEARLVGPASGGGLMRAGKNPYFTGRDAAVALLTCTPELRAAVDARLGGSFAFRSYDTLIPGAAERVLVTSRWSDDWRGLQLQTWVAQDASPAAIQTAIEALIAVRDVFARSPGVAERP
jgi:hypothetical protein